jgi:inositol-1,3,4-trisphosphate 5/6-kinase/inositol-tetrakisphosphate 1-kinase
LDDFGISTLDDFDELRVQKSTDTEPFQSDHGVTVAEIRPVADSIRKAFRLELFGFDILVTRNGDKTNDKEVLVVDVNYFPSYKEVTNFSQLLAQYLAQCGIEGRLRSFESGR